MNLTLANSQNAKKAYDLVLSLQSRFVTKLNHLSQTIGESKDFEEVTWLRDEGRHGGGSRFEFRDEKLLIRQVLMSLRFIMMKCQKKISSRLLRSPHHSSS